MARSMVEWNCVVCGERERAREARARRLRDGEGRGRERKSGRTEERERGIWMDGWLAGEREGGMDGGRGRYVSLMLSYDVIGYDVIRDDVIGRGR